MNKYTIMLLIFRLSDCKANYSGLNIKKAILAFLHQG